MGILTTFLTIFVISLYSLTVTATYTSDLKMFVKSYGKYCGPTRLNNGWVSMSTLACYRKCADMYSQACYSFLYNDNTKWCTPGGKLSPLQPEPTLQEGDLYILLSDDAFDGFSSQTFNETTAVVARFNVLANYTVAQETCQCMKSYLYVPKTKDKFQLLENLLDNLNFVKNWIGMNDLETEGQYVWTDDGQVVDSGLMKELFETDKPDNYQGSEDCIMIYYSGALSRLFLDDLFCYEKIPFFCEKYRSSSETLAPCSVTATNASELNLFIKSLGKYCGPTRLNYGWTSMSALVCYRRCANKYSQACYSFLYNDNTKWCTPGGKLFPLQPEPTLQEGDLYVLLSDDAYDGFSLRALNETTANVARYNKKVNYTVAQETCQCMKSSLYVPKTTDKFQLLLALLNTSSGVNHWIGMNDIEIEGQFVWTDDGQVVDKGLMLELFEDGKPDNYGGLEDCVMITFYKLKGRSFLDDLYCTANRSFICEKYL
nr:collectin-10-like [Biomphalaria glabrata]